MADKKVSELVTLNTASGDDLLLVVNDPSGTPASRKITVNNLFGNVVVSTTHKARTTFNANVIIATNSVTATANVAITGGLSVNSTAILPAVQDRMQVANTVLLVNDRLQMANAAVRYARRVGTELFGSAITGNVTVQGTLDLVANQSLVIAGGGVTDAVPGTSNATTENISAGTIWYSNNHLYIAVDANTIKRVNLSTF